MAGRGTGIPNWFACPVARRNRDFITNRLPDGHRRIRRTGRTKPAPGRGNLPPRKLDTSHEYVCSCGHRGWTCHQDILDYPLVSDLHREVFGEHHATPSTEAAGWTPPEGEKT